jgi:hypothetical protein
MNCFEIRYEALQNALKQFISVGYDPVYYCNALKKRNCFYLTATIFTMKMETTYSSETLLLVPEENYVTPLPSPKASLSIIL